MTILDAETVLRIIKDNDLEGYVEPSPRAGKLRVAGINNDVSGSVEAMGGMVKAAELLNVSADQVDEWIDNYHVPQPYADEVKRRTGYWIYSIQESRKYLTDGMGGYWPHVPNLAEWAAVPGHAIMGKRVG